MARVTVEDCLPLVDNRFALVLLGTKRARQLMAGARPLLEAKDKPPVLALREIATGKVRFDRCGPPAPLPGLRSPARLIDKLSLARLGSAPRCPRSQRTLGGRRPPQTRTEANDEHSTSRGRFDRIGGGM